MNAYLNWGRWIVHCPHPACVGAVALEPRAPGSVCLCRDDAVCEHGPVCMTIIRPVWPDDLEAIDRAVAGRPRANRNWLPGETVAGLLAENELHGVT